MNRIINGARMVLTPFWLIGMLVVIVDSDTSEKRGRKTRKISSIIEWFFFSQTSCVSEGNQKSKKFLLESFHSEVTEFRVCMKNLKREYDAFSAFNRNLLAEANDFSSGTTIRSINRHRAIALRSPYYKLHHGVVTPQ